MTIVLAARANCSAKLSEKQTRDFNIYKGGSHCSTAFERDDCMHSRVQELLNVSTSVNTPSAGPL